METITVSNRREFIDEVVGGTIGDRDDEIPLSKAGADELWDIWEYRHRYGGEDDYLIIIPAWMSQKDFGMERPFIFAGVEYDNEDKGAVLFRDARMVDPSIVENQVWSAVELSDVLDKVDISDSDYVDDPGKCWIGRSAMSVFEMGDDDDD